MGEKREGNGTSDRITRRQLLTGMAAGAASLTAAASPPAARHTQAATPAPTSKFKPITLTTHNWGPPRALTAGYEWWAAQVTRATGGAVTFKHLYSGALVAGQNQLDGVKGGLFDIAGIATGYAPGKTPLWTVDTLRSIGATGDVAAMEMAMAEIASLPELEVEFKNWNAKFLFYTGSAADEYLGTKPLKTMDDFKGLRLWTYGPGNTQMFHNLGAVPSSMTTAEIFEAISRGTLDGTHFPIASGGPLGLADAVKYVTFLGTGPTGWPVVISLSTWKKLDPEIQKIMLDEAKNVPEKYAYFANKGVVDWLPKFAEKAQITSLPATEKAKMKERAIKPTWESWVKERGAAGRKVLDALVAATAKYKG